LLWGHCYSGWPDRRIHTGSSRSIQPMNAEDKVFAFTFALVAFVIVANLTGLI